MIRVEKIVKKLDTIATNSFWGRFVIVFIAAIFMIAIMGGAIELVVTLKETFGPFAGALSFVAIGAFLISWFTWLMDE